LKKVNKLLTYAIMLDLVMVMYIQFVLMLIEFQKVLSQELKCLCSKTTTVLSESTVPETVAVSLVYIFIVVEVIKYII